MDSGRPSKNIQVRMPVGLLAEARARADQDGFSLGRLIRTAIDQYLRGRREEEAA